MKPYIECLNLAKRYDKIVDYGSPVTAWTNEMFQALKNTNGDKIAAMKILKENKKMINSDFPVAV